jgi:hypothetical protein
VNETRQILRMHAERTKRDDPFGFVHVRAEDLLYLLDLADERDAFAQRIGTPITHRRCVHIAPVPSSPDQRHHATLEAWSVPGVSRADLHEQSKLCAVCMANVLVFTGKLLAE